MSDHDKKLFIEQHNDGYAILRGGSPAPRRILRKGMDVFLSRTEEMVLLEPFLVSSGGLVL